MEHASSSPVAANLRVLPIAAATVAVAIFVIDSSTPIEVNAAVLYIAVVLMAGRFCQPPSVLIVAVGCVALAVLSDCLSPGGWWTSTALINRFLSVLAIGVTTYLVLRIKQIQRAACVEDVKTEPRFPLA
jgi:hypothetical protein